MNHFEAREFQAWCVSFFKHIYTKLSKKQEWHAEVWTQSQSYLVFVMLVWSTGLLLPLFWWVWVKDGNNIKSSNFLRKKKSKLNPCEKHRTTFGCYRCTSSKTKTPWILKTNLNPAFFLIAIACCLVKRLQYQTMMDRHLLKKHNKNNILVRDLLRDVWPDIVDKSCNNNKQSSKITCNEPGQITTSHPKARIVSFSHDGPPPPLPWPK